MMGKTQQLAASGGAIPVPISTHALDMLMPMHVRVSATGHIQSVGPTLAKMRPDEELLSRRFLEVFEVKRPLKVQTFSDLLRADNCVVRCKFRQGVSLSLKGLLVRLPDDQTPAKVDRRTDGHGEIVMPEVDQMSSAGDAGGALINLSLGVSVVDAVQRYELSSADFAPSDPTVDMLYLIEAKSVALDESKRLNARLEAARIEAEQQAFTDMLTGLANRRAMDLALSRLAESDTSFGLMHMDLDYFKQVNDTMGHSAGDAVLQHVAQVLQDETRVNDLVARVGGDEFVLIFKGLIELDILDRIARRIIERLEEPIPFEGKHCRISASIGTTLSSFYKNPLPDRMLNDADAALYQSKDQGRACHTIFVPQVQQEPGQILIAGVE